MRRCVLMLLLVLSACRPGGFLDQVRGCSAYDSGDHHGLVPAIRSEVDDQLSEPIPTLNMEDLISLEWDELHVFHPYTQDDEVAARVGQEIPCSRVSVTENTLLVLTREGEVVEALDWQGARPDFSYLKSTTYRRQDSAFFIDRAALDWAPGRPWYVLHEHQPIGRAAQVSRVALFDLARRLYSSHGRPGFDRRRASQIVRSTQPRSIEVSLHDLRIERFEIDFCLEATHRRGGGTWHLGGALVAPRTGSCRR